MENLVKDFNHNVMRKNHREKMPISARLMDIQSEVGELSKEYLKNTKYGTADFENSEDFEMEFGDVLYSVLTLADEMNIDAKIALNKVLNKYKKRLEEKQNMGSGN